MAARMLAPKTLDCHTIAGLSGTKGCGMSDQNPVVVQLTDAYRHTYESELPEYFQLDLSLNDKQRAWVFRKYIPAPFRMIVSAHNGDTSSEDRIVPADSELSNASRVQLSIDAANDHLRDHDAEDAEEKMMEEPDVAYEWRVCHSHRCRSDRKNAVEQSLGPHLIGLSELTAIVVDFLNDFPPLVFSDWNIFLSTANPEAITVLQTHQQRIAALRGRIHKLLHGQKTCKNDLQLYLHQLQKDGTLENHLYQRNVRQAIHTETEQISRYEDKLTKLKKQYAQLVEEMQTQVTYSLSILIVK